jgi:hypothetical protein
MKATILKHHELGICVLLLSLASIWMLIATINGWAI